MLQASFRKTPGLMQTRVDSVSIQIQHNVDGGSCYMIEWQENTVEMKPKSASISSVCVCVLLMFLIYSKMMKLSHNL